MSEPITRTIVSNRHWMHIWKVGHTPCVVCHQDSRVIATVLDANDDFVRQIFYCNEHAPELSKLESTGSPFGDIARAITLGLGASFSVSDEIEVVDESPDNLEDENLGEHDA